MSSLREPFRSARSSHLSTHYPGDLASDLAEFLPRDAGASGASMRIDPTIAQHFAQRRAPWWIVAAGMASSAIAACLVTAVIIQHNPSAIDSSARTVAIAKTNPTKVTTPGVESSKLNPTRELPTVASAGGTGNETYTDNNSASDDGSAASLVPSGDSLAIPSWSIVPSAATLDSVSVSTTTGTMTNTMSDTSTDITNDGNGSPGTTPSPAKETSNGQAG